MSRDKYLMATRCLKEQEALKSHTLTTATQSNLYGPPQSYIGPLIETTSFSKYLTRKTTNYKCHRRYEAYGKESNAQADKSRPLTSTLAT